MINYDFDIQQSLFNCESEARVSILDTITKVREAEGKADDIIRDAHEHEQRQMSRALDRRKELLRNACRDAEDEIGRIRTVLEDEEGRAAKSLEAEAEREAGEARDLFEANAEAASSTALDIFGRFFLKG